MMLPLLLRRTSHEPAAGFRFAEGTLTDTEDDTGRHHHLIAHSETIVPSTAVHDAAAEAFGSDLLGATLLSAVAGYVDTAGVFALFGLFTAHVTGDLVTAGLAVTERVKLGGGVRLAMIPVFMLAVAATRLFTRVARRRGSPPLAPLLALMTAALAAFCVVGVALHPFAKKPDDWGVILTGSLGVVAMAVQNTLMRDVLSGFCPTTIMTGNLTQFTIDLVELVLPARDVEPHERARAREAARQRLVKFGLPIVGFMTGAALGAWLTSRLGLWSIGLPTLVVGALTMLAFRSARAAPPPA